MKLSAWASVSDIVPTNKTTIERIIRLLLGDKHMFRDYTADETFSALKKAGVDGIELLVPRLTTDENILDAKKIFDRNTIPVLSIHQSLTSFLSIDIFEIEKLCKTASFFKAHVIVLHSGALDRKLFDGKFVELLKALEEKYSLKFGIENMPKTPYAFYKRDTFDGKRFSSLLENVDLSITFDTTHLGQVGGDILSFYEKNKKRIVNIHFSDYKKHWLNYRLLFQNYTHLPLMKGELPVQKFLKLLKNTRYSGLITMEIGGTLEEICESARMIKLELRQ